MQNQLIRSFNARLGGVFATLIMALFILSSPNASAHAVGQSVLFVSFDGDSVSGRVEVALADVNEALGLSLPTDFSAKSEDLTPHSDTILRYISDNVSVALDGANPGLPITGYRLYTIELAQYFVADFNFPDIAREPEFIDVKFAVILDVDKDHRNLLVVERDWKSGTFDNEANFALIFGPDDIEQRLDLSDSSVWRGFVTMVKLGTHHIWIGIDHILFLLALLLPSVMRRTDSTWVPVPKFTEALLHVIKIVTVFTVAHTITLSAAALGALSLPGRLVESIIALSIAVVALDIIVPIFRKRIWWIVFAFGLFHGLGFASVLGEIGIPQKYMVHSLLGFNVGVELGQIAIVCAVFPVLYLIRKLAIYSPFGLRAGAAGMIVIALYWFIERAFLIDLPAGAILNKITGMN